jgi:hypothetical protein
LGFPIRPGSGLPGPTFQHRINGFSADAKSASETPNGNYYFVGGKVRDGLFPIPV